MYLPFCNTMRSYTDTMTICKFSQAAMRFHLCFIFLTVTEEPYNWLLIICIGTVHLPCLEHQLLNRLNLCLENIVGSYNKEFVWLLSIELLVLKPNLSSEKHMQAGNYEFCFSSFYKLSLLLPQLITKKQCTVQSWSIWFSMTDKTIMNIRMHF